MPTHELPDAEDWRRQGWACLSVDNLAATTASCAAGTTNSDSSVRVRSPLLDCLDQFGIPATCFVSAQVARARPQVVWDLADRGYEIGIRERWAAAPRWIQPHSRQERIAEDTLCLRELGVDLYGFRPLDGVTSDSLERALGSLDFFYVSLTDPLAVGERGAHGVARLPARSCNTWWASPPACDVRNSHDRLLASWQATLDEIGDNGGLVAFDIDLADVPARGARFNYAAELLRLIVSHAHLKVVLFHEVAVQILHDSYLSDLRNGSDRCRWTG